MIIVTITKILNDNHKDINNYNSKQYNSITVKKAIVTLILLMMIILIIVIVMIN